MKYFLFAFALSARMHVEPATAQQNARPNIIFILADDLGWSSLSSLADKNSPESRSDYHETPNLDKLVMNGMRFSRGYASASICSPSRRSILFGHSPAREGDESFAERYHPGTTNFQTIPEVLKAIDSRYKTAHFGKWDMRAGFSPEDAGYDESDGDTGNRHGDLMTDEDDKWATHFVVDDPKRMYTLTGRATNFMQRQVRSRNPFYLQISHYATHVDFQMLETTYKKYQAKSPGGKHDNPAFAAMLEDLDNSIGRILDEVERLGIGNNTFIFFMADNGATEFLPPVKNRLDPPGAFATPMRNYPLRGGKWTLYEGGIRVPLIVRGPGVAADSQSDVRVVGWDLLSTFASLAANADRSFGGDGGSFAGVLKNKGQGKVNRPVQDLLFHRYNNSYPHSALIAGDVKVIKFWRTGKLELYNLRDDPGEVNDLAPKNTKEADALAARLVKYLEEVNPGLTTAYKK